MKKIKIHYTISQRLCGEIKRVCVIGQDELRCELKMLTCFPNVNTFFWKETFREVVDGSYPSGIFNDDPCCVVGVMGGAALSDSGLQFQSHS